MPGESNETSEAAKGNAGLIVGILVALIALAGGAVTIIIILKKKNKKTKKESK